MKSSINFIFPILYGFCGFLFGFVLTVWWAPNWLILTAMIISFPLFFTWGKKSLIEIEGNTYDYVRCFGGELGKNILLSGYNHLPLGFINKTVKRFLRGNFGFHILQTVEHSENIKNSESSLYDYEMDLSSLVTLKIGQNNNYYKVTFNKNQKKTIDIKEENPEKIARINLLKTFNKNSGGEELIETNFSVGTSSPHYIHQINKDIKSTLGLIAMHRGFKFMQANADWNLEELILFGALAARELNKTDTYRPDTLQKTLQDYSLELVSVIVDVKIEKELAKAIRASKTQREHNKANILKAEADKEVIEITAEGEAEAIKTRGKAEILVKEEDINKTGKVTREVFTKNVEDFKKVLGDLEDAAVAQNARLATPDMVDKEFEIIAGTSEGKSPRALLADLNISSKQQSNILSYLSSLGFTEEFFKDFEELTEEEKIKKITDVIKEL